MNMQSIRQIGVLLIALITLASCDQGNVNIFSIEDDITLGQELRDTIRAQPEEYPVLGRNDYPDAYETIEEIVDEILASGQIKYAEEFEWETYLIHDDTTLNAFVAPGGYIFVYSGIIHYLEQKDDFVGVLGHEIAHADRRHATNNLTKQYGVATLLSLVLGDEPGLLGQVLQSLIALKFSRSQETDADEYSVIYLCETEYAANAAASFFQKLGDEGASSPPQFLSTHPSPENRVEDINAAAEERGCDTTFDSPVSEWESFQNSLP